MIGLVERDKGGVRDADRSMPGKARVAQSRRRRRPIDIDLDCEGFEDAVGRALRVVTAALLIKNRNVLGRTFAIRDAEFETVLGGVVGIVFERLDRRKLVEDQSFGHGHENVVAAAVDRAARLEDDEAIAARFARMRDNAQPASDPVPCSR